MRKHLLFLVLISASLSAQKKDRFSLELQGNTFSGAGNNFIADGVGTFVGFGAALSARIYKNFGLSVEYQKGYSEVKDISVFGDLEKPELNAFELLALYRYNVADKFEIEGNIGAGNIRINSKSTYRDQGFSEGGMAFIIGAKALYSITKNNSLYIVGSPRLYFLSTSTTIDNPEANQYYSKSTLFNLSLGLRLYF